MDDGEDDNVGISRQAAGNLQDWADGILSASKVQFHMNNAVLDKQTHPMIERLAEVGPGQNALIGMRTLFRRLGFYDLQTEVQCDQVTSMLLPSTLARILNRDYPREFRARLCADCDKLRSFWSTFLSRPRTREWADRHPDLRDKQVADLVCTIPCVLHTDAGPCTKSAACNCISWSALLGEGSEKLTKFLICSHLKPTGTPNLTDRPCWERILADFDAMASEGLLVGRRRWRLVLMAVKCDEEVRCNEFGLAHYNSNECCSECMADRATRPYTDLTADARWRRSEGLPVEAWLTRIRDTPEAPLHPLAGSRYCCDPCFFYLDLMHCVDCKGVSAGVFGGVLALLVRKREAGANQEDRLRSVNTFLRNWYQQRPGWHRLPWIFAKNLTLGNGWADLHGQTFKAANTRAAAPAFRDLARHFFRTGSDEDVSVRAVTAHLASFYRVVYTASMFPTDTEVADLRRESIACGVAFMRLRELSRLRHLMAFNIVPKVHKMQHFAHFATALNPRFIQCYAEESLIGTVAKIWKSSMSGRYQRHVQSDVLLKKTIALFLRFEV